MANGIKKMSITELEEMCGHNPVVFGAFVKADSVINNPDFERICCSVSGGQILM